MKLEKMMTRIRCADPEEIEKLISAVLRRKRELFPEWDVVYFALPKKDKEERKRMAKLALEVMLRE